MSIKFKHPFSTIIAGPSSSGKSYFVNNFLNNVHDMCDTSFTQIFWHYGTWQNLYDKVKNVNFIEGLPEIENIREHEPQLIIIDDLMREADEQIVDIFTKWSHHKNLSVFFITQNLFHQGKGQRDIPLNANYIIYFKNPRDKAQILHLSRQVYPENTKFIQEAYNDASSQPHGYLIFDLKQNTPEWGRFRTIRDGVTYVYIPRKKCKYPSIDSPNVIE